MKVLVTGANGFVGNVLCQKLVDAGMEVRAISRYPAPDYKKGDKIEWIQIPDIGPDTDWSDARLKEIDVVVHLASRVHVVKEIDPDPEATYMRTNRDGTSILAEAAVKAGVKRFVYISTAHVHGHVSAEEPFTEDSPAVPHTDYARSKWAGEEAVREVFGAAKSKSDFVIVRPPLVYGEGVKANFLRLLWLAEKQIPLPLKKVENLRSLIYVENLADFFVCCVKHKKAANETFLIADDKDISVQDLVVQLSGYMGKKALLFSIPVKWLSTAASYLNRQTAFNSLCGSLQVDSSKAKKLLGWKAPLAQEEGLERTAKWYLAFLEEQDAA